MLKSIFLFLSLYLLDLFLFTTNLLDPIDKNFISGVNSIKYTIGLDADGLEKIIIRLEMKIAIYRAIELLFDDCKIINFQKRNNKKIKQGIPHINNKSVRPFTPTNFHID